MTAKRLTVCYSGTVQGVGFRYTTIRVAKDYRITGYVRNLPDGRVEMVAEGAEDEVRRFTDAVESTMSGYIRDTEIAESPATNAYAHFDVAF